jgi:tetratricopeptide (TPR) repeat protein
VRKPDSLQSPARNLFAGARGIGLFLGFLLLLLVMGFPFTNDSTERARAYYLFSLAQQAQFQSNLPEAVRYLEQAIHTEDSSDLRLELAELYASMNNPEKAEQEAREAVKLDPHSPSARKTLAGILLQSATTEQSESQLKESEALYQDLLDEDQAEEGSVLALAEIQRGRGDLGSAAASLEKYRESHAATPAIEVQLARVYQEMGRSEEAGKLLRAVLEKSEDNRDARELLAELLEDSGAVKEAVEIYRPLTEGNPGNAYGQYRLGTLLTSAGQYQEAQEHLRLALQMDPANVRVLLAMGHAYLGSGDTRLSEDMYQRALERDAGSLEARFFLGRIAQGRADDDRALTLFGQILAQTSEKTSPQDRAFFGLASYQVGFIRYLHKDYPAATQSVKDAIEAASRPSDELYGLLVRIELDAGKMAQAREDLEAGKSHLPDSADLEALRGEILLREGKRGESREVFRALLEKGKHDVDTYLLVVQACSRAESFREGVNWATEGRGRHADSEELAFQEAALMERAGDFKKSEAAFRAFLQRQPKHAEALNYLGYMLAERDIKLDEALGFIQRALTEQPDNAAFLDSMGWVYFRLGQLDQAESYLTRAVKGSREDPTVLEHLGDVYMKRGKPSEALKTYLKAMEREPEDRVALQKKLRKLGYTGNGS